MALVVGCYIFGRLCCYLFLILSYSSIKQIAYDLNFPSQSFFGKYFSRIVGMSPTEYRKKQCAGLL